MAMDPEHGPGNAEVHRMRSVLAALRHVARDDARALPAAFYTSPDYLEFERHTLFRNQWVCLGHIGAIAHVGDYFTAELLDEQLLIVREAAGTVSVLSNVCRHRGSPVATGAGRAARFVCGYHGWTYALDGRLLAAPLIKESAHFNKAGCRLPRFASEIWQGYLFVNLDGSAPPLAAALSPIEPFIRNYHPSEQHFLYETQEVWQTNWKCLVENFMEGYHLSPLHAKTLHAVTPTNLCEKLPDGAAFTGYRANFHPQCPERGPYHPDLTPQERRSDVFYCVYPSFVVGFCPHFTLYMCISPLTADSVAIRWGLTGIADDPESSVVQDYLKFCKEFCAEDRTQLERLQRGLKSPSYVPGPLAPDHAEGTVWDIIQYMARRLGVPECAAPAASIDSLG
jgi:phenylpropionate dioxygenase-like ring-hydroxylating dioxygenase large terminal subunit